MTYDDSNPPKETNCDWLALRYVGEEMTAAERADFESLLAENQESREAVAAAVLMFAAVPLALADSETRKVGALPVRRAWVRRVGWSAVGAAACLAGMLGIEAFRESRAPVDHAIVADGKEPSMQAMGELAQHWTSLADAATRGAESIPDADADAAADPIACAETGAGRDANESVDELGVPSWLLAAVAPVVGSPTQNPPASE